MEDTKIKALIFDLDGTVIDTSESLHVSVSEALATMGYPPITRDEAKAFVGNGGKMLLKRALAKYDDKSEEHLTQLMSIYGGILAKNCTLGNVPYKGIPEVLEILKKDGYRLAVISNKDEKRVIDCMRTSYREGLFDLNRGERPGIPLKPDPKALTSVFEEMGVQPDEVIYFGDSPSDIEAGRKAGCKTCAVTWGFRKRETLEEEDPDYIIDRPEEILEVVQDCNHKPGSGEIHFSDGPRHFYTLDGYKMTDRESFYDEIETAMLGRSGSKDCCDGKDSGAGKETDRGFVFGRNLDALADLLRGGFGKHEYGEPIEILWCNFEDARAGLGDEFVLKVVTIMCSDEDDYDVVLKIEK